jgi:uncharacterized protein involved in exopolysaccharide biosynthesis
VQDEMISFQDILGFIGRNWIVTVVLCVISTGLGVGATFLVEKRFRSQVVFDIPSSYFKNPLVSEFVPDSSDSTEFGAQRQNLVKLGLNQQFLDGLAEKFNLYKSQPDTPLRTFERDEFRKRIQSFPVNQTSVQITTTAATPEVALDIANAIVEQMRLTLVETRFGALMRARDAVQAQAALLAKALKATKSNDSEGRRLSDELATVNRKITSLRTKFTDAHPEIVLLNEQAAQIRAALSSVPDPVNSAPASPDAGPFFSEGANKPSQDIFNDLLRKLSFLSIAIDMESEPKKARYITILEPPSMPPFAAFPDRKLFAAGGFVGGFILSMTIAATRELRRRSYVDNDDLSTALNIPLLGTLPKGATRIELTALDGRRSDRVALAQGTTE